MSIYTASIKPQSKQINIKKLDKNVSILKDSIKIDSNVKNYNKNDILIDTNKQIYKKVINVTKDKNKTILKTKTLRLRDIYKNISIKTKVKLVDINNYISKSNIIQQSKLSKNARVVNSNKNSSFNFGSGFKMSIEDSTIIKNHKQKLYRQLKKVQQLSTDSDTYFKVSVNSNIITEVGKTLQEKININNKNTYDYEFDGSVDENATEREKKRAICEQNGGTFWYDEDGSDGVFNIGYDSKCLKMPVKICSIDAEFSSIEVPETLSSYNKPSIIIKNNNPYILWSPTKDNIDYDKGEPYKGEIDVNIVPCVFKGTLYEKKLSNEKLNLSDLKLYATDTLLNNGVSLTEAERKVIFENENISLTNRFNADFTPDIYFDAEIKNSKLTKGEVSLKSQLVWVMF